MGKPAKMPTAEEFRWLDEATLEHAPTGAKFTKLTLDAGLLTTALEDGGDYDLERVLDLAWHLMDHRSRGKD